MLALPRELSLLWSLNEYTSKNDFSRYSFEFMTGGSICLYHCYILWTIIVSVMYEHKRSYHLKIINYISSSISHRKGHITHTLITRGGEDELGWRLYQPLSIRPQLSLKDQSLIALLIWSLLLKRATSFLAVSS